MVHRDEKVQPMGFDTLEVFLRQINLKLDPNLVKGNYYAGFRVDNIIQ